MSNVQSPYKHHDGLQSLTIPFQVPSRGPCNVRVTIQPVLNPAVHGQDLLKIWPDTAVVVGFPEMKATISPPQASTQASFDVATEGYATMFGWVQMTHAPEDGTDSEGSKIWVMDTYPPFADLNTPFFIWGSHPTAVDCPGRDKEVLRNYDWSARTWLTYSPDACMSRTVVPILCFEWGFWIRDGNAFVKELKRLKLDLWPEHLTLLRNKYAGWEFTEESATTKE